MNLINKIADFLRPEKEKIFILFLDIDGVLHTGNSGRLNFVDNLVRVIEEFEAQNSGWSVKIVVSSNWKDTLSLEDLKDTLYQLKDKIIDTTPDCAPLEHEKGNKRQKEIELWLRLNFKKTPRNLRYIAIDDDTQIFSKECCFVFFTQNKIALNNDTAEKFLKVLNESI